MTTKLQENLEKFREAFPYTKCIVDQDRITYCFPFFSKAARAAFDANLLIERMGLPLVAVNHGDNGYFVVQSNETEN